jgi:uncharacterized protein (DUF2236 family)
LQDFTMVAPEDLEIELRFVREHAAGETAGVLGPNSITWRIDREAALFLGAGRALLLQLAHPWVAAAVAQHSSVFADPVGRFPPTFKTMFTMVFGSLDQALGVARRLHRRHAAVTGALPHQAGSFPAGSRYWANETSALLWVHATLVDTALMAHELVLPPLTPQERDRYYAESRLSAGLFGIPQESQPPTWEDFRIYMDGMLDSDVLTVLPEARMMATQLFAGRGLLRPPGWYAALTAEMLPPRLRDEFQLPCDAAARRRASSALAWIRRLYPYLPSRLRYVGPYQQAVARLSGADPDYLSQAVNLFWIGQKSL